VEKVKVEGGIVKVYEDPGGTEKMVEKTRLLQILRRGLKREGGKQISIK